MARMSRLTLSGQSSAQAAGSSVTGSSRPQALIQRRERLTYELRLSTLVILKRPAPQPAAGDSCGPAHDDTLHQPRQCPGTDQRHAATPHPAPNFTPRTPLRAERCGRTRLASMRLDDQVNRRHRAGRQCPYTTPSSPPERSAHFGHRMNRGGAQISPPKLGWPLQ